MSQPDARVRDLVREGQITPEEGERLRRALHTDKRRWSLLLNPVEYLEPGTALALAIAVVAASLLASRWGVRFDGALDTHRAMAIPAWRVVVIEQTIAVVLTSLVFWLTSLIVTRQGRWQDFAVAVAVGRLPALLLGVWAVVVLPTPNPELIRQAMAAGSPPMLLLIGSITLVPFMAWFLVWLYRGFATASGMKGAKAAMSFVGALVVAEIASKFALIFLLRALRP